ncbi:MAG TPA: ABC transporter permease [Gemmatimonadaceae bacterium]|nr:ABC transporter permease [Gemmatimonadaceae bacterium]
MGRISGLRRIFRLEGSDATVQRDAEQEVRFHIEMRVQELVAKGLTLEQARAEAVRRFGDVERTRARIEQLDRERLGQERRAAWWSAAAQDVRYAVRGLRRQPGFTAVVVLTLGLAIGANATMFGIVDRLLLRAPPHVVDADRVARVFFVQQPEGLPVRQTDRASFPQFATLRDTVRAFERMAAVFTTDVILGEGADARTIRGAMATAGFFPLLGVQPALGRFYHEDEDRPPVGTPVAVLGHGFWQRELGGDITVLGRELRVDGVAYTVIGVTPEGFTGIDLEQVDAWLPISVAARAGVADDDWHSDRSMAWIQVVARLRSGADVRQANAEATAAYLSYIRGLRWADAVLPQEPRVELAPLLRERGPDRGDGSRIATWLAGVAAIVLVIACANVGNLLLARAMRRRREIAVRLALGAGRGRLIAQLLTESLLLAALGGVAGLLIARWVGAIVRSVLLPDIVWTERMLDPRILGFSAAAALLTGLLAGLVPALQALRPDITVALKAGAREGGGRRSRLRTTLMLSQAALSVVLLVGAGLFVLSLHNVRTDDLGFAADRVLVAGLDWRGADVTPAERIEAYRRAHERVRELPGVRSASIGSMTPFYTMMSPELHVPGWDSLPRPGGWGPLLHAVSPEHFATMGTRILSGRGFTDAENRAGVARVAMVNQAMAALLWPGENPLGKCLIVGDETSPCSEVIGVVQDARATDIRPTPVMQYYVPVEQGQWRGSLRTLFIRTDGEPDLLIGALRSELQAAAPAASYAHIRPMLELIDPQIRPWRLGATMFTAFGLLALALAAVGLYSVMAYSVAQRTHEMGVRMALGAGGGDVVRLVLGEGLRIAGLGIALGALIAIVAGRRVAGLLYDVAPNDPRVFGVVVATLLVIAAVASMIPALRASRVDPITALRAE